MFPQSTQSQSVQYEIPYSSYDVYKIQRQEEEIADLVGVGFLIGAFIGLLIFEWSMWRLTAKAGYRGVSRWIWFLLLGFPLTSGLSLAGFVLVPWPVQKQLKKQKQQMEQSPKLMDDIDIELERLRRNKV